MKQLLKFLSLTILFVGCANYTTIRSPRYFNEEVDILDYYANPYQTTWTVRAMPGEQMKLVFLYETITIDFTPDKNKLGEFIFTVNASASERAEQFYQN
jgi:hypothetical protein